MDGKSEIKTMSDVLQKADIALDSYDDIFSDFDPSPFQTRLLSEDFLYELRRRYASTGKGGLVVNFTLPKALRSEKTEALIRKRIKDHFKTRIKDIDRKAQNHVRNGGIRLIVGIGLSLAVLLLPQLEAVPVVTIFSVLIWYSIWSGLENISEASAHLEKKKGFAEKFMKADYTFLSQEDVVVHMARLSDAEILLKADTTKSDAAKPEQSPPQKTEPKPE